MDYIKKFDIELEREYYYAGEKLKGWIVITNVENLKVRGVRVMLRGKAHVEWKVTRSGERRTVKEDQYFIDDKTIAWGKDKHEDGAISIMPRGEHRFPFEFQMAESSLPCSFESKYGTVRYYLRVIIDIPYASPPQGLKYFTIIGPHLDSMDEKYLGAVSYSEQYRRCCLCCTAGAVHLQATLERSAYCCGENIKLKYELQNGSEDKCWVVCRLMQHVQFRINKGVLGLTKDVSHKVWEVQGPTVEPQKSHTFTDFQRHLRVPVVPPTHIDVCKVLDIYYVVQMSVKMNNAGEYLHMEFPVAIATLPFRVPTSTMPKLYYEIASDAVEGGQYVSPEFLMGQVYDGEFSMQEEVVLYRPVYVCVKPSRSDSVSPVASTSHESRTQRNHSCASRKTESSSVSRYERSKENIRAGSQTDETKVERLTSNWRDNGTVEINVTEEKCSSV